MVWIRNTLLVQITVILAIACLLLIPRLLFPLFQTWHSRGPWRWLTIALFVGSIAGIAGNQLRISRKKMDIGLLQASNGWLGFASSAALIALA